MTQGCFLHYVSLDGAGGVELQFVEFLQAAAGQSGSRHAVVACGRTIHPLVRRRLAAQRVTVDFEKYAGPFKLPKWPRRVRIASQRRRIARSDADLVIIWNRLRDSLNTLAAAGATRCIYWERGASWFAGDTPAKRRFLARVPAIICNSQAAKRMLELRWGYAGPITVIPNALRPSLVPAERQAPRTLAPDRPLRLGVAARLAPVKGVALAIQAVAGLVQRGVAVELRIAGDGPQRTRLEALVEQLDIASAVVFEGLCADMAGFYRSIDLLVHPALREPFGQIAVEAGAYGVPAVAAAVDGLVEVVSHDETGICVKPTLALAEYPGLGGDLADLVPFVYDPAADRIAAPKLVDPAELAAAIEALAADPARYTRYSANALAAVTTRFDFDRHVRSALDVLAAFAAQARVDTGRGARA